MRLVKIRRNQGHDAWVNADAVAYVKEQESLTFIGLLNDDAILTSEPIETVIARLTDQSATTPGDAKRRFVPFVRYYSQQLCWVNPQYVADIEDNDPAVITLISGDDISVDQPIETILARLGQGVREEARCAE